MSIYQVEETFKPYDIDDEQDNWCAHISRDGFSEQIVVWAFDECELNAITDAILESFNGTDKNVPVSSPGVGSASQSDFDRAMRGI